MVYDKHSNEVQVTSVNLFRFEPRKMFSASFKNFNLTGIKECYCTTSYKLIQLICVFLITPMYSFRFKTEEEVVRLANNTRSGLAGRLNLL